MTNSIIKFEYMYRYYANTYYKRTCAYYMFYALSKENSEKLSKLKIAVVWSITPQNRQGRIFQL